MGVSFAAPSNQFCGLMMIRNVHMDASCSRWTPVSFAVTTAPPLRATTAVPPGTPVLLISVIAKEGDDDCCAAVLLRLRTEREKERDVCSTEKNDTLAR